jgi:hypothetical protein
MTRWLPIPGYEEYYSVSDDGRVWSARAGLEMQLSPNTHGYHGLSLHDDNSKRYWGVHQLVMLAFTGPPAPGEEVRHADRDRSHNDWSNLSYGTKTDNQYDSVGHGTHANARKRSCNRRHLLVAPNLQTSASLGDMRVCKSCGRARSRIQWQRKRGLVVSDMQELSDQYYVELGFTLDN